MNVIDFFQEVFNLIVIICFISINNRTVWRFISIRLQGINITKASRGEETFNGLPFLGDHEMNLETIKIPFLARLIAAKILLGVYLRAPNTNIVTHSNREAINHIDSVCIQCFPYTG